MIRRLLAQYLLKAIALAALALVLFGVMPSSWLVNILFGFVALRLLGLGVEAWQVHSSSLTDSSMPGSRANDEADSNAPVSPKHELRPALLRLLFYTPDGVNYRVPPRTQWEIAAEALGLLGFVLILPAVIALYGSDFFSLRMHTGWCAMSVVLLCLSLYAWPHFTMKAASLSLARAAWWAIPFFPVVQLLTYAVETRHPYLDPFNPDHAKLAADRVLSLRNNIVAGRHSDWVLDYAKDLDRRGQAEEAMRYYREGLRLDPGDSPAATRLASLEGRTQDVSSSSAALNSPTAPYWSDEQQVVPASRRKFDAHLQDLNECTVMLVPIGDVPGRLLDCIAFAIQKELALPAYVSSETIALPPHTRIRGLATGRQWEDKALISTFVKAISPPPTAPVKCLLITTVDIYGEGANYTFSVSFPWGAVVSCARFGKAGDFENRTYFRTAKQSIGALIKSFGISPSPNQNCVTSYSRDLPGFDAKGNRPDPTTAAAFRRAVIEFNLGWEKYKARNAEKP